MSNDVYQCRECGEEFIDGRAGCPLCGADDVQVIDMEVVTESETEEELVR